MSKTIVPWKSLVDVALNADLPPATREFAISEVRRLADYLDDVIFYDRAGELNIVPFNVGRPTGVAQWR